MGGGNHQVLAAKKYAMMAVSIQTTGASSIDSAPPTAFTVGTETITLDERRATPFTDSRRLWLLPSQPPTWRRHSQSAASQLLGTHLEHARQASRGVGTRPARVPAPRSQRRTYGSKVGGHRFEARSAIR